MLILVLLVALAGAVGGVVNALTSDNGFVMPKKEEVDGKAIYRPGFFGNVIVGLVAAVVSWGLYGPGATLLVVGGSEAVSASAAPSLSFSVLAGAVLVGIGGARWLSAEVDKKLLKAAASKAATASAEGEKAAKEIATASPTQALHIAEGLTPRSRPAGQPPGPDLVRQKGK